METLRFKVHGSAGDIYDVEFMRDGLHLRATCTCAAGAKGQYCKHRLDLLNGDVTAVDGTSPDAARLGFALAGSDVETAIREIAAAERAVEAAKAEVSNRKRALARIMAT